jgi:catechol 2,3-dioxygenase-like lactoylglutathione lyase family enzyme
LTLENPGTYRAKTPAAATVARPAREGIMLTEYVPIPTLGVADLSRSREFYESVLGFAPRSDAGDGVVYEAGTSAVLVYPSGFAGTNKATAMSFQIPEEKFDAEIAGLRAKGIEFQTFEVEGLAWVDGVAMWGDSRAAWFTDPDGNILNVETGVDAS